VLPLWFDIPFFFLILAGLLGFGLVLTRLLVRLFHSDEESPPLTAAETLIAAYGLGFGGLAMIVLSLGALRLLYAPVLTLVAAAGLALLWRNRPALEHRRVWEELRPRGGVEWLFFVLLAGRMAYHFLGCFLPVFGQDELTYHLTMPRQYLYAHCVHCTPNLLHGNFPYNAEMLYLLCLAFGSEMLAKLLHWSMLLAILAALLVWVRRIDRDAGYLSLLVYLVAIAGVYVRAPMETGSDVPTAMFLAFAFLFASGMKGEDWRLRLVLASLMNGLAWGVKYVAPVFVTPLLAAYLVWRLRELRLGVSRTLLSLGAFVAITLAVFAPWMVKNTLCTNNPVYPALAGVFPSPAPYDSIAHRLEDYEQRSNFYRTYGGETTFSSFSLLRSAVLGYGDKLAWSGTNGDYLLPLYVGCSITGLLAPILGLRGFALAGLVGNLLFFFFYGSHLNRFFSVSYPLGAVLVGTQTAAVFRMTSIPKALHIVLAVLLAVTSVNFQIRWNELMGWHGKPLLTREAHKQYLERHHSGGPEDDAFWEELPNLLPEGAYILGHGIRYPYFIPRRVYCVCDYEEELLDQLYRELGDWDRIGEELRRRGFTHLLLRAGTLVSRPPQSGFDGVPAHEGGSPYPVWPAREWLERNTRLLAGLEGLELREILPD
jgi:hypothetical protein